MLTDEKPFPVAKVSLPDLFRGAGYYYMIGQMSHIYGMLLALCLMRLAFQLEPGLFSWWSPGVSPFQTCHYISLGLGLGGCVFEAN